MSLELRVPSVGESITEVQIGDWLKQEGQAIRKDENLVLIESEKATLELPSPAAGVLVAILKRKGDIVRVGEVIGTLDEAGQVTTPEPPAQAPAPAPSSAAAGAAGAPIVLPAAQRVLAEAGIPAKAVLQGTGPGGRVTKEDALKAVSSAAPANATPSPAPPAATAKPAQFSLAPAPAPVSPGAPATPAASTPGRDEEVVPMSPLRRTVARRLVEAQASMAMLTTFNEIDMSAAMALRKQYQEAFTARHGVKLGFMSMFVKAVIEGLKDVPQLNAEVREQSIVYRRYYDIGVAIGGGKGLVVPVLRNAERMGFATVEKTIAEYAARAKDGRIKPEELAGGTFTISNGGIYGSLLSTPIINPPQSGILGMHSIQERAVVVDGQIVARPMMYVALTYDHRIVDGREAVTFLKRVKEIIEAPARMLIEA